MESLSKEIPHSEIERDISQKQSALLNECDTKALCVFENCGALCKLRPYRFKSQTIGQVGLRGNYTKHAYHYHFLPPTQTEEQDNAWKSLKTGAEPYLPQAILLGAKILKTCIKVEQLCSTNLERRSLVNHSLVNLPIFWGMANTPETVGCKCVDLKWFAKYKSVVAILYATELRNVMARPMGFLVLLDLKNPCSPLFLERYEHGPVCMAIHPTCRTYLAVGLNNGQILIYNFAKNYLFTKFRPLVQVNWCATKMLWIEMGRDEDYLVLFAFTSQAVVRWRVYMTHVRQINHCDITRLLNDEMHVSKLSNIAVTSCNYHPEWDRYFLIGASNGIVYKWHADVISQPMLEYRAHESQVNTLEINQHYPEMFLSSSTDEIKIWLRNSTQCAMLLPCHGPILHCEWIPFYSTAIAVSLSKQIARYDILLCETFQEHTFKYKEKVFLKFNLNPVMKNLIVTVGKKGNIRFFELPLMSCMHRVKPEMADILKVLKIAKKVAKPKEEHPCYPLIKQNKFQVFFA